MGITDYQLVQRKNHIGSSDMAAIMGVDPWRNAHDVYLDKTGQLEPLKQTAAMRRGDLMERALIQFAREEIGALRANQRRTHQWCPLAANVDAIINEDGRPVEAKSTSWHSTEADEWGQAGTDEVPDRVIIQCHVHMVCVQADLCHVPVYIDGRGFEMFAVPLSKKLARMIETVATDFWKNHVKKMVPPTDIASIESLERRIRVPKGTADVGADAIERYLNHKEEAKVHEQLAKTARAELLDAMDDAEVATGHPDYEMTYMQQQRKSLNVSELRANEPQIYKQYERISTHRVLRKRKAKI